MARKDNTKYNTRPLTFSKALQSIIDDCEQTYYERLATYFEDCAVSDTDANKAAEYAKAAKKIRDTKRIYDADIALVFGVSPPTVCRWHAVTNPKLPPLETPLKLAEIFDVSTDFLLGYAELPKMEQQQEYAPFKEMGIDISAYNNLVAAKTAHPDFYNRLISALNVILTNTELLYNGRPIAPEDAKGYDTYLSFPVLRGIAEYLDSPTEKYLVAPMEDVVALLGKCSADTAEPDYEGFSFVFDKFSALSPDILDAYKLNDLTQALKSLKHEREKGRLIEYGKSLGIDWPQK